jgi:hypothetical protein
MRQRTKPQIESPDESPIKLPIKSSNETPSSLISHSFIFIFLLLAFAAHARAQTTEAHITVVSLAPPRVRVEGARSMATRAWSFRNAVAGISGLGDRIENLSLTEARGSAVAVRKLAPGEYESEHEAVKFSYEIRLDPPSSPNDAAHVSWLTDARGALMPGDLLPLPLTRARLTFKLPSGWNLVAPEKNDVATSKSDATSFDVDDADAAIFFAGSDVRERVLRVRGMDLRVAFAGDWAFADEEAAEVVASIVKEHVRTFDNAPRASSLVVVAPFPRQANASEWAAETRGATVLYLSGRAPSKVSALARLEPPLTHELFHLWIPNALRLGGDYDWFYEGFTNYQALRASQLLGFITFDGELDALARAYDACESAKDRGAASLVEASSRRWSGANALIYNKGTLVAALYDLRLRKLTGGKRSLDDLYRALFRDARASAGARDGNAFVIAKLNEVAGDREIVARFVEGTGEIDLGAELSPYGLRVERAGARTHIFVSNQLSGSQRDLLRQIGYNN